MKRGAMTDLMKIIVTAVIAVVLLNSTIRFYLRRKQPRQLLAAMLSGILTVLLVVFYYRWIASLFNATTPEATRIHGWILRFGTLSIRGSWLRIGPRPDPHFNQTFLPIEIVAASYILRAGIYRFTDNDRFRKIHDLTSAYAVSLTFAISAVTMIGIVYRVPPLRRDLFIGAVILVLVTPSLRYIGRVVILILDEIWQCTWKALRTGWKYGVLLAVMVAQFIGSLDESIRRVIEKRVLIPLHRLFASIDQFLTKQESSVDNKFAHREEIQVEKDLPREEESMEYEVSR